MRLRLNILLSWLFLLSAVGSVVMSVVFYESSSTVIGMAAVLIFVAFSLVLVGLCAFSRIRYNAFFLTFAMLVLLSFSQRFLSLMASPVNRYSGVELSPSDFTMVWLAITFFSAVVIAAIFLSHSRIGETPFLHSDRTLASEKNIRRLQLLFLVACGIQVYGFYYLGVHDQNILLQDPSFSSKLLLIVFNFDLIFLLANALFFIRAREKGHLDWRTPLILLVPYAVVRLALGSRGGIFDGALIIFLCFMVTHPKHVFRVNFRTLAATPLVLAIFSLSFAAGDAVRDSSWIPDRSIGQTFKQAPGYWDPNRGTNLFTLMSDRLGLMDPLLVIVNDKHYREPSTYISLDQTLKSSVDRVIPGQRYGYPLPPERAFKLVYTDATLAEVQAKYHGDAFSLFGISYIHFGLVGGAIFTFLSILLLGLVYGWVSRRVSIVLGVVVLFTFYFWFQNFGIDNWIARFAYLVPMIVVFLVLLRPSVGRAEKAGLRTTGLLARPGLP